MVYTELVAINQSISALKGRAVEINSTLLILRDTFDDFRAACGANVQCRNNVPMDVFHGGLDAVRNFVLFLLPLVLLSSSSWKTQ